MPEREEQRPGPCNHRCITHRRLWHHSPYSVRESLGTSLGCRLQLSHWSRRIFTIIGLLWWHLKYPRHISAGEGSSETIYSVEKTLLPCNELVPLKLMCWRPHLWIPVEHTHTKVSRKSNALQVCYYHYNTDVCQSVNHPSIQPIR